MNIQKNATSNDFFVEITSKNSTSVFKFSMSKTGVLDYFGEVENFISSNYQQIDASSYYSPSWYTYLPKNLQAEIKICFEKGFEKLDVSQHSFLLHIGAILLAVKEHDTLLVAELLHRRPTVFAPFLPMVLYIIKPIAAEALFAWMYGQMHSDSSLQHFYSTDANISANETDTGIILYVAAKEALKPIPHKESIEEMFIRYFQENSGFDFTIGIVGACCHFWTNGIDKLNNVICKHVAKDFVCGLTEIREARQKFFDELTVTMQAEPYNPHDANAIAINIEDIEAKISGNGGKTKAGYIRATGAAILRKALPEAIGFKAKLWRIGNSQDSKQGVVLKVTM